MTVVLVDGVGNWIVSEASSDEIYTITHPGGDFIRSGEMHPVLLVGGHPMAYVDAPIFRQDCGDSEERWRPTLRTEKRPTRDMKKGWA